MARNNPFVDKIDKFVGKKIYDLRLSHGYTREELAQELDVTQQQISKYEHGENRISIGRLILIAKVFKKDINYFYNDFDIKEEISIDNKNHYTCLEVSRNFMKIKDPEHQKAILGLVRTFANHNI